jgi:hypothetical protein
MIKKEGKGDVDSSLWKKKEESWGTVHRKRGGKREEIFLGFGDQTNNKIMGSVSAEPE